MNKILKGLRSMRFGIVLLGLILFLSFWGSIITQGQPEEYYTAMSGGGLILALGLDHIYTTPLFLGLGILLIVNLTLCSLIRLFSGCKLGPFLVHLSLVLILLVGGLILYTGTSEVYELFYDEPLILEDGTIVNLNDFSTLDDNGQLSYHSTLDIQTPDGQQFTGKTSVNHPVNFGGKKYFQENYGFTVCLDIYNTATETGDRIYLTEPVSLSVSDDGAGIVYMASYTDFTEDENGELTVRSNELQEGAEAAFLVSIMEDGNAENAQTGLVRQGTTLQVGDVQFTFVGLRTIPGIRIKTTSRIQMGLLYGSFCLMIAGLWLCFFQKPIYIGRKVKKQ